MSRKELSNAVRAEVDTLTVAQADAVVNAVINGIIDAVKTGDGIVLTGFGSFTTKITKARVARNPSTGALVNVPTKSTIRFRPSKALVQVDLS
jgi:nucleoid DNA-binding protein